MVANRATNWGRHIWWAVRVGLAAVAIGIAVYWFKFAPVSVARHTVSSGELAAEVLGTGTLDAHVKATVSTKIAGRLVQVNVDQGDQTYEGQVLAQLDDADLQQEIEIEAANVSARTAAIDRLKAEIALATATLELATANETRTRRLRGTGTVSQEELDKSVEALAVARANQGRADAALAEGRKLLVAAEKARDFRRARLADAVIKAPFAGVVVRRDRNAGDVVVPGSAIVALVATEELWVGAWVDETQVHRLKPGQLARIVFRSEPDHTYAGKVVRLGRETDRETRETRVDIASEKLPTNWSVGQRAEVYIEVARQHAAALVPWRCVVWRGEQCGVFVEVNGRAEWRSLTIGLRGAEAAEVLSGLQAGEVVLSPAGPGGADLSNGQRVSPP